MRTLTITVGAVCDSDFIIVFLFLNKQSVLFDILISVRFYIRKNKNAVFFLIVSAVSINLICCIDK